LDFDFEDVDLVVVDFFFVAAASEPPARQATRTGTRKRLDSKPPF
jgi:hypothetical protein